MYRPYFCTPPGSPASPWSQGYIGPAVTKPTPPVGQRPTAGDSSSSLRLEEPTQTCEGINCVQTAPLRPNTALSYPQPPTLVANSPCKKPITTVNYTTLSESQRVLAQENPSTFVMKQPVQILPGGTDVPIVTVQNTPASITVQKQQTATLAAGNNSYSTDPVTRFARYFPPQPPGLPFYPIVNVPPYGLLNYPIYPNSSPQAQPFVCVPNNRFSGSVPPVPSAPVVAPPMVTPPEPLAAAPQFSVPRPAVPQTTPPTGLRPVAGASSYSRRLEEPTRPKPVAPIVRRPAATQNVEPM